MTRIFHITERNRWQQAELEGEYRPASLGREGFIHCSLPHQLAGVANALFRGQRGLVCLVIDPERVRAPVRYEALGTTRALPSHLWPPQPGRGDRGARL